MLPSSLVVGILILVMLVIYGFIKTMPQADPERKTSRLHYDLKFETAPELWHSADDETSRILLNCIWLIMPGWLAGHWMGISWGKPGDKYELTLRIYEAGICCGITTLKPIKPMAAAVCTCVLTAPIM